MSQKTPEPHDEEPDTILLRRDPAYGQFSGLEGVMKALLTSALVVGGLAALGGLVNFKSGKPETPPKAPKRSYLQLDEKSSPQKTRPRQRDGGENVR